MDLNQITVPVIDLEKAIGFYQKLGLRLIVEASPHYARFECTEGSSTFSLHKVNNLPTGEGIWVYFEVQNLDEYIKSLLDKGLVIEELPIDKSWLWREARLKDPDNNQIIFYFAGSNRINPPWRIETAN